VAGDLGIGRVIAQSAHKQLGEAKHGEWQLVEVLATP